MMDTNHTKTEFTYLLHLADNALLLAQRNAEWTGHGPVLEQDIAITNIALDLLGQARNFYQQTAALYTGFDAAEKNSVADLIPEAWLAFNRDLAEDDLAFLRTEGQYRNLLLAEQPAGDWAQTVLKQFFFSALQQLQYRQLQQNGNSVIAAIAEKGLKEITYHLRWSSEWVIRLGDGTDESRRRLQAALENLWPYTGEFFKPASYESNQPDGNPAGLANGWLQVVNPVFAEAGLPVPPQSAGEYGGKEGRHSKHLALLLAEMQHLQRIYPNAVW